jgi:hypothetical protein
MRASNPSAALVYSYKARKSMTQIDPGLPTVTHTIRSDLESPGVNASAKGVS